MLTKVEQIVVTAHRLVSCVHRPTNESWLHTKNKVSLTYFTRQNHPQNHRIKWMRVGVFKPPEPDRPQTTVYYFVFIFLQATVEFATCWEVSQIWKCMSKIWEIPFPENWWPQDCLFLDRVLTTSCFNCKRLYLMNKMWCRSQKMALQTTRVAYSLPEFHELKDRFQR